MLRRKEASIDHYDRRTFFRLASAALAAPALVHGGQGGAVAGARDWRRVAISVDMEGATGVVAEEETNQTTEEYRAARRWMLSDVNAAVEGALDAGATYIEVHDTHNISKRNIPFEDLHPKAHLVRGGNTYFWRRRERPQQKDDPGARAQHEFWSAGGSAKTDCRRLTGAHPSQ